MTPDGTHLAFESVRSLTGYHNRAEGEPIERQPEVFLYSAADTELICATCAPTGAVPATYGEEALSQVPVSRESNTYMKRWLSDDGSRIFFETKQALLPRDIDGVTDVYEWERVGSGTCTASMSSSWNNGCIFLLSGGDSKHLSYLVDADSSGDNVFFERFGAFGEADVARDRNQLYDARVNGGFFQSSLSCAGSGCQGVPPAPPIFATPASVTFTGLGDFAHTEPVTVKAKSLARRQRLARALKSCHRERTRIKRLRCEVAARRQYGVKSTKPAKAGNNRRAK